MTNSSVSQVEQQRVDAVLIELDRFAQTESTPSVFYRELLGQTKPLLRAAEVCLVVRLQPEQWGAISSTSVKFGQETEEYLPLQMKKLGDEQPRFWSDRTAKGQLLGCALRGKDWALGGIVALKPDTMLPAVSNEPTQRQDSSDFHILAALAELADGYRVRNKALRWDQQSENTRSVIRSMLASENPQQANQILVNGARCLIDADRVTLLKSSGELQAIETIAMSGMPNIDSRSSLVIAMNKLELSKPLYTPTSVQLEKLANELQSVVAIAVPIANNIENVANRGADTPMHCLILEWFDRERYVSSAEQMGQVLPWLTDSWQSRLLPGRRQLRVTRLFRYAIATACIACFIIFMVTPAEMTILAQGTLQPSEQRFVFSPTEGYVDKIHIADGTRVKKGDVVAEISSPQLQLQLSRIAAEIGLVDQKRDGLNITLNQLKPADDQSNVMGSRLAGEVLELEAKRANLLEQKQLLDNEQTRLQLRSPIDGTVVAWEVEKYLENRPVQRGDTLFLIAAVADSWRLESCVADWESGYVIDAYRTQKEKNEPLWVEYTLASSPGERMTGKVLSMSDTMIEVAGSPHLEVIVLPDALKKHPRLGTSATISIPCGQFPRWFIWTRSILDAVRRRFWI